MAVCRPERKCRHSHAERLRQLSEERTANFDLEKSSPLQVVLAKPSSDEHIVVFSLPVFALNCGRWKFSGERSFLSMPEPITPQKRSCSMPMC